jgi:F420 biosynthesis protein FbiB-like protein
MDGPSPVNPADAVEALMRTRRSVRRYRPGPVPDALLRRLIESACWAHNRQPWRFVMLDAAARARLAHAMADRLRADRTADGDDAMDIARDAERSIARVTGAPAALLVCLTLAGMDTYDDPARTAAERTMAAQSTAMAVQNLLLAAHAHGLGAAWMCAPLFCPDVARAALNLPDDFESQALITLGWPAASRPRGRKAVDEILFTPRARKDGP